MEQGCAPHASACTYTLRNGAYAAAFLSLTAAAPPEPIYVTIKVDQTLAVGDQIVRLEDLSAALRAAAKNDKEKRLFLRGDRAASYGRVMEFMDTLRAGGFLKVGLVGAEKGRAK